MVFCDQCGKQLKDGANFCNGCGAQVGGGQGAAFSAVSQPEESFVNSYPMDNNTVLCKESCSFWYAKAHEKFKGDGITCTIQLTPDRITLIKIPILTQGGFFGKNKTFEIPFKLITSAQMAKLMFIAPVVDIVVGHSRSFRFNASAKTYEIICERAGAR